MSSVEITTADGKTSVRSPYHPDWPSEARARGGRWSGGVWVFDSRDEERVRALAREIYGTDGSPDPGGTVSVRIAVGDAQGERGGQPARLYEFGRLIASRFGRDDEPRLADGVILIHGGFAGSAGSHSYIQLGPLDGTVVEVRDVPRTVAVDRGLEIVGEDGPDHEALRAERERLIARLAEIDAILG
jgi:hypothetical protein